MAKTPTSADPRRSAMGRKVKMDSRSIHIFRSTQYTVVDPWLVPGGQVSGIAGGSKQFSTGVSRLVKKSLDCTVPQGTLTHYILFTL